MKIQKFPKKMTLSLKNAKTLKVFAVVFVILLFKYRHIIGIAFSKDISDKEAIIMDISTSLGKAMASKWNNVC